MMLKKNRNIKNNAAFEKYILIVLLSSYLLGVCIGCYFIFSSDINYGYAENIVQIQTFGILLYFVIALILKYSGILKGIIYILITFLGIQNSANYCNYILNKSDKIIYSTVLAVIKDSTVTLLLILYIIVIINQIINKKYIVKKDLKYFSVYFTGALIILLLEYALKTFIF